MSSQIPSNISHRAQLYGNVNRPGGASQPNRTSPTETPGQAGTSDQTSASQRPDLGEGLSTEERDMILDQFPPSTETSMRIYGSDRGEQNLQPESLGNRIDLRG